jgi:hypothetical protein
MQNNSNRSLATSGEFYQWKGIMRYEINNFRFLPVEFIMYDFGKACTKERREAEAEHRRYQFPPLILISVVKKAFMERLDADYRYFDAADRPQNPLDPHVRRERRRYLRILRQFAQHIFQKYCSRQP